MVSLAPARMLLRWKGRAVTAGLLGVPKSAGSMRLTIDPRCQNALEVGLLEALRRLDSPQRELSQVSPLTCLPHFGMWAEMILGPGDQVSINLDDLQELHWPEALAIGSAVGPALSRADLEAPRNGGVVGRERHGGSSA